MHVTNEICQLEWEETGDFFQPYYSAALKNWGFALPPPLSSSFYRNYLLQMSFSTLDEPCAMCDPERRGVHCEAMFVQSVKVKETFKKIFLNIIFQTSPASVSFKLSTCAMCVPERGFSVKEWLLLPCLWSLLCVHKNTSSQNSRVVGRPNSKRPTGETKVLETALEK